MFIAVKVLIYGVFCLCLFTTYELKLGLFEKTLPFGFFLVAVFLAFAQDIYIFSTSTLRANLKFSSESIAKLICFIPLPVFLGYCFVGEWAVSFVQVVGVQGVCFLAAALFSVIKTQFQKAKKTKISRGKITTLLSFGLIYAAFSLSASLLNSVDILMLGFFKMYEFCAEFSFIHKTALFCYIPLGILLSYLTPILAAQGKSLVAQAPQEAFDKFLKLFGLTGILAFFLYLLAIRISELTVLSEKFPHLISFSQILGLYILPIYLHAPIFTFLCATRSQLVAQLPAGIATAVSVVFDFFCIAQNKISLILLSPILANLLVLFIMILIFYLKNKFAPLKIQTFLKLSGAWIITVLYVYGQQKNYLQHAMACEGLFSVGIACYLYRELKKLPKNKYDLKRIYQ